jgi:pimeloyl-ACP methyl ester carboxylesterase
MNLFFFGTSERQLFGAYHTPAANVPVRGSALLCPPWGPEYFVAHRTLRQLAVRLADSGYHVLRFDYFGTGDSAGEREEGDLASWVDDARTALEELQDVGGDPRITVFGMRLGAVVARRLAKLQPAAVRDIVLWDPVADGKAYLAELHTAQAEIDRWSLTPHPAQDNAPTVELLGTPLPPAMADSIRNVTLDEFRELVPARVLVFFSDNKPGNEALCGALREAGTKLHTEVIPGQTPWREETLMQGRIPNLAVERMVEVLR